ncbi:hypothetical protein FOZ63_031984, partial [Perkinsus olseni]
MSKPHRREARYGLLALETLGVHPGAADLPLELLDRIWRYARAPDLCVSAEITRKEREVFAYSRFFEPVVEFFVEADTNFPPNHAGEGRLMVMLMSSTMLYEARMEPFALAPVTAGGIEVESPEYGTTVCRTSGDFYGIDRIGLMRWRRGSPRGFELIHDGLNVFHREIRVAGRHVLCGGGAESGALITILTLDTPGGRISQPPLTLSVADRLNVWTAFERAEKLHVVWTTGEELKSIEMAADEPSSDAWLRRTLVRADWVRNTRKDIEVVADSALLIGVGMGSATLCMVLFDLDAACVTHVVDLKVGINSFRVVGERVYLHERASPFGGRIFWKDFQLRKVTSLRAGMQWKAPDVAKVKALFSFIMFWRFIAYLFPYECRHYFKRLGIVKAGAVMMVFMSALAGLGMWLGTDSSSSGMKLGVDPCSGSPFRATEVVAAGLEEMLLVTG